MRQATSNQQPKMTSVPYDYKVSISDNLSSPAERSMNKLNDVLEVPEEQFKGDLMKASRPIDLLADQALAAHREGKSKKFPK